MSVVTSLKQKYRNHRMSEHLTAPSNTPEVEPNTSEVITVSPRETEDERRRDKSEQADTETTRTETVGLVLQEVHETLESHDLESLVESIDFSNRNKYGFRAWEQYAAQAGHIDTPTRIEGQLGTPGPYAYGKEWGNPSQEAHRSHQVTEKAGVREATRQVGHTEELVPRKGIAGKLGFKQKVINPKYEEFYVFDYTFNTPALHGSDGALRAGNYAGQCIDLSVELTKDQAGKLSGILAENPKAARQVLDGYVRATGDYGAWNAELYDEKGDFHNPVGRYGEDFVARDVRPNYDAVPDLEPQIVGLLLAKKQEATEGNRLLPTA